MYTANTYNRSTTYLINKSINTYSWLSLFSILEQSHTAGHILVTVTVGAATITTLTVPPARVSVYVPGGMVR